MKTDFFRTSIALACSYFLLQSCCKGYCSDENIFVIDLQGFSVSEVEKIKILTYERNSFTNAIDSYYVSTNNIIKKDTTRAYPDKPFRSGYNFQIVVETPGLRYNLSDIETKNEDCNCGSGTFKSITSYTLNGVQTSFNSNSLVIKK